MPLRRKKILALHRWLGLLSALFLVVLSITGLALNHTERLGLDGIRVKSDLLLKCYGMQGQGDLKAFSIHGNDTLTHLGDQLYYNESPLASTATPLAYYSGENFTVIACPDHFVLLDPAGQLIEAIETDGLPFEKVNAAGRSPEGAVILVAENGLWKPDNEWLHFNPYSGPYTVKTLPAASLPKNVSSAILAHHQGQGLSLYRVLLDLHAGRLFGWGGRTLMDLTAVAILLLISSGLTSWFKKSRRA
ncbi:MAG: hypothetical protein GWO81_02910 [Verrucomicrobia bacterium]|nr:hypothetical protein [Verrucomicrobiota bacterium]